MASKYERIAADLRHRIQTGEWSPGEQLPPETDLVSDYGVALNTLRTAIGVLRNEGLIESRQGTGTFVSAPRQRVRRTNERYHWEKDRVHLDEAARLATGATEQDTGLQPAELAFFVRYETTTADERVASWLGIDPGEKVLHREYATSAARESVPLSFAHSYIPAALIESNPDLFKQELEPWPGGTQHQLSTVGIELASITDQVTARPPTAAEAERLALQPGVSLLVVRKTSTDTSGRIAEVMEIVMPGDRHELVYVTPLDRWST